MALPAAGEFGRVKRNGDQMRGDLQFIEINQPAQACLIEFLATVGGVRAGGIRQNGNDMEFYDLTVGAWVKLSSLTGTLGDIEYFTAAPAQTIFNLAFTYTVGSDTLGVYIVGAGKMPGPGAPAPVYAETGPTQVTFNAVAPFTPFTGGEIVIFWVPARPIVNDTYLVKGDAADASPLDLDQKLNNGSGLTKAVTGSPANSIVNLAVDHATAVPLQSTGAGSVGVATKSAREDHVHPAPAAPATMLVQANGSYVGNGIALPRRSIVTGLTTLYFLLLHNETAGPSAGTWRLFINAASGTKISQASANTFAIGAGTIQIVGGNFEVTNGDGTNANLTNYKWFAIGL